MPPQFTSRYQIVRRLGAGGMGEVFLARDTELERQVALKVMSAELARDPDQRRRFRTEARAASGLSHPHICVIHEVSETEDERPFLAMEYLEGQTLDVVLQQRRLNLREILQLGIEVAEALDAAHARGLVHRDIKPANLMLLPKIGAKVLDFGLAKKFGTEEMSASGSSAAHTRTGMLLGTPQYMSPEQVLGRTLDPRTDIFSLGVVLYELAVGQRPFLGNTVGETINNIVNQPAAPLDLHDPVYSPSLDNIILKCLEKDPEKRYASAHELVTALRRLKEDSDRVLAEPTRKITYTPESASPPAQRQPTALWKLATADRASRNTALRWLWGFVAAGVLGLGVWAVLRNREPGAAMTGPKPAVDAQRKSVAVLPFVNLSADKSDEYLSDGMTEELLNALTKVKGLRVPGRSSSFAFKGKNEEGIFRKVGEQLGVEAVLEGSVRKAGDKLRVTAQLINVADGFHLWSNSYDRDMTNIFSVQSEIASRVAEALQVQLLGRAQDPTQNIEAYKLYLQGRYLWNRRTGESLLKAIDCFNEALAIDPGYALAYSGLSDCYQVLPNYRPTGVREVEAKSRAAALKALELDPTLAGPLATLASLKETYQWDWKGAEADYRRSIELDPCYASARQWYAESLSFQGRSQEAVRQAREALELDPLSPVINAVLARVLTGSGGAEEAVAILQKQIASDPSFALAHTILGWAYIAQGKMAEATTAYEQASRLNENSPSGELGFCYARSGRTDDAKKVLEQLTELQREGRDMNVTLAMVHHGLTNDVQAFACLDKAVEEHSYFLQMIPVNPCWSDARSHPRFQAILGKMNLVK